MWKWLRNLLLAGLLLAGTLKLLAWYEAGQDAQRLSGLLGPTLQLNYGGLSAGLDGSVTLTDVALAVKGEHAGSYRADRVVVETPNVFWLLKHALLGEETWPGHFSVALQGVKLPPNVKTDAHWLDVATLVPFETAGCAAAQFSPADLRRMDANPEAAPTVRGDFRYDGDTRELDGSVVLTAPDTASVTLSADLQQFDGAALHSLDGLRKLRIGRLGLDYADNGFLKRRNAFCAQRANIATAQFVEQHLAAVQAQLQQHGIEASADVLRLYRRVIESGGRASILSLPNSGFTAGTLASAAPEELMRQLNVTARYADAPPVMFRLAFLAPPPDADAAVTADASGAPATSGAATVAATPTSGTAPAPTAAPGAAAAATGTSTPPATPSVAPPPLAGTTANGAAASTTPTVAAKPAAPPGASVASPSAPATDKPGSAGAAGTTASAATATTPPAAGTAPASAAKPSAVLARPPTSGNGLEEFDRAAAKLAPPPPVAASSAPATGAGAPANAASGKRDVVPGPDVLPSSAPPAPTGNTALSLVWKPTFERLPPDAPERRGFDTIDFAGLRAQTGRFVRVITQGGKKVDGYVVAADDNEVELRVNQGGGTARFMLQKADVHEVLLAHAGQPPA